MSDFKTLNAKALTLKSYHIGGRPIVFTNVYSIPTARLIAQVPGTKALTTASYAIAHEHGLEDDDLTLEANLSSIAAIARVGVSFNLPVAADFQDGYGERLEEGIRKLIEVSVVGCNLEDFSASEKRFYSIEEATARIRKVLDIAKELGVPDFVLNARTDVLVHGGKISEVIERGKAYLAAGATTIFVWGGGRGGVHDEEVKTLVKEFKGMLNVIYKPGGLKVGELENIGVARVSMGPWLQKVAQNAIKTEAERIIGEMNPR